MNTCLNCKEAFNPEDSDAYSFVNYCSKWCEAEEFWGSFEVVWPNCPTPDCKNLTCRWAGTGLCYPCSKDKLGEAEMSRRYKETRSPDGGWNGKEPA